jgi:hypothetical protein
MAEAIDLAQMDEAGFERLYRERIAPLFESREQDRLDGVKKFRSRLMIAGPAAGAVGIGVGVLAQELMPALIVIGIGGVAAYAFAHSPLSKLAKQVKHSSLSALAEAIGCAYGRDEMPGVQMARFRTLSLLPACDRTTFDDHFHGERHGCAFDMHEAHLETEHSDSDGGTDWVTVFRGQLIRIAFPKKFNGVTIVRRDAGVLNALSGLGKDFQRIGIGEARFERAFEVYGTDQVEARYLLHPVFLERLLHLEETFKGKQVRCAFEGGDLLVAVECGDKFEVDNMFSTLADPKRARALVKDIAEVMGLMDAVLTAEKAPLAFRGEGEG